MRTYMDSRFSVIDSTLFEYHGSDKTMVLPSVFDGIRVNTLAPGCFNNYSLETLTLPRGIENIQSGALSGCKKLKKVVLPSAIGKIEANAMSGCNSLETVSFTDLELSEAQYRALGENSAEISGDRLLALQTPENQAVKAFDGNPFPFIGFIPGSFNFLVVQRKRENYANGTGFELLNGAGSENFCRESEIIRLLARSGKPSYTDNETEAANDSDELKPYKTSAFIIHKNKTGFSGNAVYVSGTVESAYFFMPSLIPVTDRGNRYFLYRRCYLTGSGKIKYISRDIGIFTAEGVPVGREKAGEIYEKYRFMRIM